MPVNAKVEFSGMLTIQLMEAEPVRSDPRIGYYVSLAIAGVSGFWLLSLFFMAETWESVFGYNVHPITFLSIFLLLTGLAVSQLFRGYAKVRRDLEAGENVLARWTVDAQTWRRFAGPAHELESADKRGVLMLLYVFIAVICGGLALALPRDAHIFGWIALGLAAIVTIAFLVGLRVYERQLVFRDGKVVIGRGGLMFNGILHVWDNWLSWLEGAEVVADPAPMLVVVYAYWARYGPQTVVVRIPLPKHDVQIGTAAAEALENCKRHREEGPRAARRKRKGGIAS